jgi:O-6-methylguanine DNA methyltransferase
LSYTPSSRIRGRVVKMDLSKIKTEDDIRAALEGYTEFEKAVYVTTFRIPKGKVSTYSRIAAMIGRPNAYRAVANTLHKNPLYPVVPCHRVVKNDGSFGGEEKAAAGRRRHVREEGVPIEGGRVVISKDILF